MPINICITLKFLTTVSIPCAQGGYHQQNINWKYFRFIFLHKDPLTLRLGGKRWESTPSSSQTSPRHPLRHHFLIRFVAVMTMEEGRCSCVSAPGCSPSQTADSPLWLPDCPPEKQGKVPLLKTKFNKNRDDFKQFSWLVALLLIVLQPSHFGG